MEKAANIMRIIAICGAITAACAIVYYYVYICIIYPYNVLYRNKRKVHVTDTNVDENTSTNTVPPTSNQNDAEDESKYEDLDGYDIESNYSDVSGEVFVKRAYKCVYNSICI